MKHWHLLAWFPLLMAGSGCSSTPSHPVPAFVNPPPMKARVAWSRKLPRGASRSQKPVRVAILVLDQARTTAPMMVQFLLDEEKRALGNSGPGDFPYHFYMDGEGGIYESRSLHTQVPERHGLDPEGTVWIAVADKTIDIYDTKGPVRSLVHLVTHLCYRYEIHPETLAAYPEKPGETMRLVDELNGQYFRAAVKQALDETLMRMRMLPQSSQYWRNQRLRVDEAEE